MACSVLYSLRWRYMYVYLSTCIYIYIYTCMCISVHVYIYIYIYIYISVLCTAWLRLRWQSRVTKQPKNRICIIIIIKLYMCTVQHTSKPTVAFCAAFGLRLRSTCPRGMLTPRKDLLRQTSVSLSYSTRQRSEWQLDGSHAEEVSWAKLHL